MTKPLDPLSDGSGPSGPDQSPSPTRWPAWLALLLVAVLVAMALYVR